MDKHLKFIGEVETYSANNYHPLEVVIDRGERVWVYDVNGNKYLDMISAYSAVNQGHCHPKICKALVEQAGKITLTSRAMHNSQMGSFLKKICDLSGFEKALPMNTGAEAVETAIKMARKWGYQVKHVEPNRAEIIVFNNNFHGRTVSIVSFSSEPQYKDKFGPLTPGFTIVEYANLEAVKQAINPNTVAILAEPIQGEGGVIVPYEGYLQDLRNIASENNILLMFDEIQTGLGRTGKLFAYLHEEKSKPDVLILGKALGGGVYPVSLVLANAEVMGVFQPGDHGSTFGGNPMAAAVGMAALDVLQEEQLDEKAQSLGEYFRGKLREMNFSMVKEIRGKGLLVGVEIKPEYGRARPYCEKLLKKGVICKDTHESTIRFAPPLVVLKEELDWALKQIHEVLS